MTDIDNSSENRPSQDVEHTVAELEGEVAFLKSALESSAQALIRLSDRVGSELVHFKSGREDDEVEWLRDKLDEMRGEKAKLESEVTQLREQLKDMGIKLEGAKSKLEE